MEKISTKTGYRDRLSASGPALRHTHLLTMLATALVATWFPVGAAITNGLDSLVLTFLRFALAALLFAPIVAWRYGKAEEVSDVKFPLKWLRAREFH